MWIVDSSVWIGSFNGVVTPQTDQLDQALGVKELGKGQTVRPKVVASTATIRRAGAQVNRLYLRSLNIFPLLWQRPITPQLRPSTYHMLAEVLAVFTLRR